MLFSQRKESALGERLTGFDKRNEVARCNESRRSPNRFISASRFTIPYDYAYDYFLSQLVKMLGVNSRFVRVTSRKRHLVCDI